MSLIMDRIKKCGLVPVIKLNDADNAVSLAKALVAGGIDTIEITFRTSAAKQAIQNIVNEVPEMLVGAGTVITPEQLSDAQAVGANFIVSPGFDDEIVKAGLDMGLVMLPGCVTPTEIIRAIRLGLKTIKFFPAESYGGINTIKALSAPFGGLTFVPTGGINEKNAVDYWKLDRVLAVGGSWMAPEELINAQDFNEITRRSKEAVALMKTVR